MGSLIGHVVPGVFFCLYAFWITLSIFWEYYHAKLSRRPRQSSDNNNSSKSRGGGGMNHERQSLSSRRCSRLPPSMTLFKLMAIVVGMLGEYFTALDENWNFEETHNGQHMTMFGFFFFNALFEMLYHYRVPGLPPSLDKITGALAFGIEGLLFLWHLHGRNMLDIQVHTFLVYAIAMCTVGCLLEIQYPGDMRTMLFTTGATMAQGTWFLCVGLILYPPTGWERWDPESHEHRMWVTMMFTWNIAAVLTLQIVTGMLIYNVVKRKLVAHQGSHAVIEENGNHGYVNVPQEEETLNMNLLTNFESDSEENFA